MVGILNLKHGDNEWAVGDFPGQTQRRNGFDQARGDEMYCIFQRTVLSAHCLGRPHRALETSPLHLGLPGPLSVRQ